MIKHFVAVHAQGISKSFRFDFVITIDAVFAVFSQINIVDTGSAVKHSIVKYKTFKMKNPEEFTFFNRDSIDYWLKVVCGSHCLIPDIVAFLQAFPNQTALGSVKINLYIDF